MLWIPWEPSSNGNTEEIENPKENDKKIDLLYGCVFLHEVSFSCSVLVWTDSKVKNSPIFMNEQNNHNTKYIVKPWFKPVGEKK